MKMRKIVLIILFLFLPVYSCGDSQKFLLTLYKYEISEFQNEEEIVKNSLLPTLKMYLENPHWGADIEISGYLLEVLKRDYPEVLEILQNLVKRGQVNAICSGYFREIIGFPLFDMEKSEKITREILENSGIFHSGIISAQKGFGEGFVYFMKKYGYKIAVVSKKFLKIFKKEIFPYYEIEGIYLIPQAEINYNNGLIQTVWLENRDKNFVLEKEREGFKPVKISDYLERLKEILQPEKLNYLVDYLENPEEVEKFSLNYRMRQELLGCETLIYNAKIRKIDTSEEEEKLENAWKYQFLSKIEEAKKLSEEIIESIKKKLNLKGVGIDTKKNIIIPAGLGKINIGPISSLFPPVKCPYPVKIECRQENVHYHFETYNFIKNRYDLKIDFINKNPYPVKAKIFFKRNTEEIIYSPTFLEEKIVKYPLKKFLSDSFYLPLTNGLIGLAKNIFLIKHNSFNHIACKIEKKSKYIVFEFNNILPGKNQYQFTIAYAPEEPSLNLANNINTFPLLTK